MTPRAHLMTCESVSDVTTRNINRHSYVPVVHDGGFGGLFFAERFFDATPPSGKISERVSAPEETLVGADASILDFIRDADQRPCRLGPSSSRQI